MRMPPREVDEFIHIGTDGPHPALHGRNGITPPLQTDTLPPHGAETPAGHPCGATAVHAGEVAPENEDLIVAEFRDTVGSDTPPDRSNHTAAHPNQYLDRGRYDRRRTSRYVQTNEQSAITGTAVSVEENSGRSHPTNSVRIMMCAR